METSSSPETGDGIEARAFRLNITVKPETKSRLDQARNKKGIEINVSQVCDRAINGELDRCERPGLADVVARLRVESDRRRGGPYRKGHQHGQAWARTAGSWAEICHYAQLTEADVKIADVRWVSRSMGNQSWDVPGFVGRFAAPQQDYPKRRPYAQGAPSFLDEGPMDSFEEESWVDDVHLCDQFWRGWLAGVQEVYAEVSQELEPIAPVRPQAETEPTDEVPDVDPDDIPF